MKYSRLHESGQTILELVVVVGVVALVLTALVSAVISSLRYGQVSRSRSSGVKYAQEGLELVRKLRDSSTWSTFLSYSGGSSSNWCLDEDGIWAISDGSGCPLSSGSMYWRMITFAWTDPLMEVTSEVSWGEHVLPSSVTLKTYFSQWR